MEVNHWCFFLVIEDKEKHLSSSHLYFIELLLGHEKEKNFKTCTERIHNSQVIDLDYSNINGEYSIVILEQQIARQVLMYHQKKLNLKVNHSYVLEEEVIQDFVILFVWIGKK